MKKQTVWWVVGIGVAALAIVVTGGGPDKGVDPIPIPVGAHDDVSGWETPAENLGPESRFVFEAPQPEVDAEKPLLWYGYLSEDAVLLVNGEVVGPSEFADQAVKQPPIDIDVIVVEEGELATVSAVFPAGW